MSAKRTVIHIEDNTRGRDIFLDYSLVVTNRQKCDIVGGKRVYSLLILQIERGVTTAYEFIYDVSRNRKKAVALLETLVYNSIMPNTASDVIADIL